MRTGKKNRMERCIGNGKGGFWRLGGGKVGMGMIFRFMTWTVK